MQLPADLSFSSGWVSSFIKRHQLVINGERVAEQEDERQGVEEQEVEVEVEMEVEQYESEDAQEEQYHADEVEQEQGRHQAREQQQVQHEDEVSTATRSGGTRENCDGEMWRDGVNGQGAKTEMLLDWIVIPGNYSRWWLLKSEDEKEPLCSEINLFARSYGLRDMGSAEIRQQISVLVLTFQAAHTWLRQKNIEYPLDVKAMTLEQEGIKSHVLQMCPHYEKLVPVLAAYVSHDDIPACPAKESEPPVSAAIETATIVSTTNVSRTITDETSDVDDTPSKPAKNPRTTDGSFDDETKAQKRRLFELECARIQSEIETRNVQLLLEKTLARKKLLDAGISTEEANRIFPL
ncbi:unnamed protein product [Phytophthora fragariaefolia]|uniref:Unnamed protein product n=1 Tax=Phytophthora fragariaefolia TaxID=1490495 RepID=A0A9W6WSH9_9STRA|nr:unnamed protein product [Phytophthora fragariaefolia]